MIWHRINALFHRIFSFFKYGYLARSAYFSVFFCFKFSSLEEVAIIHRTKSGESVEGRVRGIIVVIISLFGTPPGIGSGEELGAHKPQRPTSMRSWHVVFPWTSLFLERFGANFDYLLNSRNQLSKPTDLMVIFFAIFCFDILYFECDHRLGGDSIFVGKSALKCV